LNSLSVELQIATSEHFLELKAEVASLVAEHNDVVGYAEEILERGSFELGSSSTGEHAHLAALENMSATLISRRSRANVRICRGGSGRSCR